MTEDDIFKIVQYCKDRVSANKVAGIHSVIKDTDSPYPSNTEFRRIVAYLEEGGKYITKQETRDTFVSINPNYKEKTESEKEFDTLTLRKLRYEAMTAKWIFYTYWITFGLSIIALFISIIALSRTSQ
ncbi:MAG TPA: hypothetical protein VIU35_15460 [Chitinophagaceae bacterium]